jgi:hypothetical protein
MAGIRGHASLGNGERADSFARTRDSPAAIDRSVFTGAHGHSEHRGHGGAHSADQHAPERLRRTGMQRNHVAQWSRAYTSNTCKCSNASTCLVLTDSRPAARPGMKE